MWFSCRHVYYQVFQFSCHERTFISRMNICPASWFWAVTWSSHCHLTTVLLSSTWLRNSCKWPGGLPSRILEKLKNLEGWRGMALLAVSIKQRLWRLRIGTEIHLDVCIWFLYSCLHFSRCVLPPNFLSLPSLKPDFKLSSSRKLALINPIIEQPLFPPSAFLFFHFN